MFTLLPFEGTPEGRYLSSADEALTTVAKHLRDRSVVANKERVDLVALHKHSGEKYTQVEAIPDAVYAKLKALHGVATTLMLPPDADNGVEAVVLFSDAHAALKGLPVNKVASMLLKASGLEGDARGDCFLGKLVQGSEGALVAIGSECAPQFVSQRDWLEAAQKARSGEKKSGPHAFDRALRDWVQAMRKKEIASAVGAATAAPGATEAAGQAGAADSSGAIASEVAFKDAQGEVVVTVNVPPATKAKHVRCTIKDASIKLEVLTLPEDASVVVDGYLFQEVSANDCTWCLEDVKDGRQLTITLEKKKQMTWLMLTRNDGPPLPPP
jgi:hypothetical protein